MANCLCVWVAFFFSFFCAHTTKCCCKQYLYRSERTALQHDILGKVRGTKDHPTDQDIGHALTRDCSTLTREKCHGSSRPDPHETRISRVTRIMAGRVESGQKDSEISRVGSGRVRRFSNLAGRVESGREVFKVSRVGSGPDVSKFARVGSGRVKTSRSSHGSGRVS